MRFAHPCIATLLIFLSLGNHAFAQSNDTYLSGFGTLGVVHSDNRDLDIVRELTQGTGVGKTRAWDFGMDSVLGLQVDKRFNDSFSGAIQVITKRKNVNFKPEIAWAFAKYTPSDTIELRAGRLGFDVFMLADSRNVNYTLTEIRPPIESFGTLSMSYLDGADLVISKPVATGIVRAKTFYGLARERTPIDISSEEFDMGGSPMYGANLEYQGAEWVIRASYASIVFKNSISIATPIIQALQNPSLEFLVPGIGSTAKNLDVANQRIHYFSIAALWSYNGLELQGMINRFKSSTLVYPNSNAAYLTVSKRFGRYTPYASVSAARPVNITKPPQFPSGLSPQLDLLNQAITRAMTGQINHQTSLSAGLKYDLTDRSNIKVQFDYIDSKEHLLIRNATPNWNPKSRLVSVAYNFIF